YLKNATNTGLRTKLMPTLDADITDTEAAEDVENLVCEWFEERGYILPRIGRAPKRAFPFRTDAPFAKLLTVFKPRNGESKKQRVEILCDGQQVVAFGIHEDTKKDYAWPRGAPGAQIKLKDLPYLSADDASLLMMAVVEMLVRDHGYEIDEGEHGANGTGCGE